MDTGKCRTIRPWLEKAQGVCEPATRIKTGTSSEELLLSEKSRKSDAVSKPYQNPIC